MRTFLHTIALEPARWTPLRVARPLSELLPSIARAGFCDLEIFEPHLALAENERELPGLFTRFHLAPVILSSDLEMNPAAMSDLDFQQAMRKMEARIRRFRFRKVRLLPGSGVDPSDEPAVTAVAKRIGALAERSPGVEFLLESQGGSIADSPSRLAQLVRDLAAPNVGILFRPTVFERDLALRQVEAQGPWIRHLHLENRAAGDPNRFVPLGAGAVSWPEIVEAIKVAGGAADSASLEFVPSAVCSVEAFNLDQALAEAVTETQYAESL